MTELYKRKYVIRVDTIQITELVVSFTVTKTLEPEPNTCDLVIYNLNAEHRGQLSSLVSSGGPAVEIIAGYENNHGRVYLGQLREVTSYLQKGNWITELHSGDAERALAKTRINKSYGKGTPLDQIVKDMISGLRTARGNTDSAVLTGNLADAGRMFLNGVTLSGSIRKELSRILSSMGKEWSVQDGETQIIDKGSCLPGPTVKLDSGHGLIGSPTIGSEGLLKVKALMNHQISPGRALEIESKEIKRAFYRVERCEYIGDSAEQSWYVDLEASLIR
jgi:hypothetical protein